MRINFKLQNKLLFVICFLFIIVFFSQFIFQNLFFNTYYKKHQSKLLNLTIDTYYKLIKNNNLTKDKQNELTKNNKILISYVDKQAKPIVGNIYSDETVTVKTKNINKSVINEQSSSIINKKNVLTYLKYNSATLNKNSFDLLHRQNILSFEFYNDIIYDKEIYNKIYDNTTKNTDYYPIEDNTVNYTRISNVNIEQHMTIIDYLSNPFNIKPGTKILGTKEKYLVITRGLSTGYIIASISMAQSDEIIDILNNFNIYIILFTLVLVILLIIQFSHRIVKNILKMKKGAQAIASQDFSHRFTIKTGDELEELADALNSISNNLEDKINTLQSYNIKLKQEYEERLEIEQNQKNLLINISHDLKTPLTVIKGYLKAIKDGVYNQNKYIDTVINSVDDINNMLSEMIELTKYRSKTYHITLQEVDFTRLIYKTYNDVVWLIKNKNQNVKLDILDDVFIKADKNAIKKVLDNLIINAIKYSPSNANIFIHISKRKNICNFSIENEGVFIDKNNLKHVFEAFYRTDKSRKETVPGNGLGLSIVKIILDHHNYNYNICNTEKGVKFSIIMDLCNY